MRFPHKNEPTKTLKVDVAELSQAFSNIYTSEPENDTSKLKVVLITHNRHVHKSILLHLQNSLKTKDQSKDQPKDQSKDQPKDQPKEILFETYLINEDDTILYNKYTINSPNETYEGNIETFNSIDDLKENLTTKNPNVLIIETNLGKPASKETTTLCHDLVTSLNGTDQSTKLIALTGTPESFKSFKQAYQDLNIEITHYNTEMRKFKQIIESALASLETTESSLLSPFTRSEPTSTILSPMNHNSSLHQNPSRMMSPVPNPSLSPSLPNPRDGTDSVISPRECLSPTANSVDSPRGKSGKKGCPGPLDYLRHRIKKRRP